MPKTIITTQTTEITRDGLGIVLRVEGDAIGYLIWALEIAEQAAVEAKTRGLLNWTTRVIDELRTAEKA